MTEADADDTELDGLAIERAVDVVGAADADPGELRETLAIVAEDGVVSRAAVDDALANASMVVTTAETRVELAGDKLDNARAATPASDLEFVSDRVDNFDTRLAHIKTRADDLGEALQEVLSMKADGDLYEIARRIRRLTNAATEVQQAADDLQLELDTFEAWLTDADRRVDELTADIDALADSLTELADVVDQLEARGTGDADDDGDDADDHGDDAENDPEREAASRWAAVMVRHRVLSLMLTDLHAELTAVQTWAEREKVTSPSGIEPRLDEIQDSHTALGERLTACADPGWTARFDEQLTALDEALTEMEPPVVWADVDAVVAEHRPAIE